MVWRVNWQKEKACELETSTNESVRKRKRILSSKKASTFVEKSLQDWKQSKYFDRYLRNVVEIFETRRDDGSWTYEFKVRSNSAIYAVKSSEKRKQSKLVILEIFLSVFTKIYRAVEIFGIRDDDGDKKNEFKVGCNLAIVARVDISRNTGKILDSMRKIRRGNGCWGRGFDKPEAHDTKSRWWCLRLLQLYENRARNRVSHFSQGSTQKPNYP